MISASLCPHEYALHLAVPEPVHTLADGEHPHATEDERLGVTTSV